MLLPLGTDRPLRRPTLVTYALVVACIGVFIFEQTVGASNPDGLEGMRRAGALTPGPGFHWWQLFTYAFLHGGWRHLMGNMLVLYVFGPNIEDRLGRVGFLVFYLGGAAAAAGMHMYFEKAGAIGASGAIAACTGMYLVLFPRTQVKVLFLLSLGIFSVSAWWFIALSVVWEWTSVFFGGGRDGVAHLAHLGGYLYGAGIALALLWLKILPREQFDLFTMGRQAYRRRAFKEAGLAIEQKRRQHWERAKAGETDDSDAMAAARAEVVRLWNAADPAGAARAYKALADRWGNVAGATVLSRRMQYDIANWFYQQKDPDAAAFAYARFLEAYPRDPEAGHVRLLLGMIHARQLNDPLKAKELIAEAMKSLEGGEAEMARRELEGLG
jgi:membrane associated rhomboid family serine protease